MKKTKLLHKLIFVVLTISITGIIFTGCKNSSSNASSTEQTSSTSSSNKGQNADARKQKITDTINSLVSAGTITSDQGTKIIDALTARPNNSNNKKQQNNSNNNSADKNNTNTNSQDKKQNFNPLSSLVNDKTITQEQADTIMSKLRENGALGSRQNNSNNQQSSNNSSSNTSS